VNPKIIEWLLLDKHWQVREEAALRVDDVPAQEQLEIGLKSRFGIVRELLTSKKWESVRLKQEFLTGNVNNKRKTL
jgi:hypothetical protein